MSTEVVDVDVKVTIRCQVYCESGTPDISAVAQERAKEIVHAKFENMVWNGLIVNTKDPTKQSVGMTPTYDDTETWYRGWRPLTTQP